MSVTTTSDIYDSIPRSSGPSVNSKVPPNARGTNKPTKKNRRAWRRPVHSFNGSSITVAVVCKLNPRHNSSHLTGLPFTVATTVPENEPVLAVVTKHPLNCSNVELSSKRYRREPTTKEVGRETVPNVTLSPWRLGGRETVPNVTLPPRRLGGRGSETVPNVTLSPRRLGGRGRETVPNVTLPPRRFGGRGRETVPNVTLSSRRLVRRGRETVPNVTLSPTRFGGRGRETLSPVVRVTLHRHQGGWEGEGDCT